MHLINLVMPSISQIRGGWLDFFTSGRSQFCIDMELLTLLFVCLLHTHQAQGSGAETKFVMLGTDLSLDVKELVTFTVDNDQFFWKFNQTSSILRSDKSFETKIFQNYTKRVTLLRNFTLILRTVQALDNGRYTAVLSGGNELTYAEYNVQVKAGASPVKVKVVSVWADSDSCNLTVTCSTDTTQLNAIFECRHDVCDQRGDRLSKADGRLKAFFFNSSIVCEHSNEVSQNKEEKDVQHICSQLGASNGSSIAPWIWILLCSVLVGIFLVLIIIFLRKRQRLATRQTECGVLREINPIQNVNAIHVCNDGNLSETTTYSLVGYHTRLHTFSELQNPEDTGTGSC
ncbi:uncharacterized protein LOC133489208 isoform X2 [Phyllopteryx taeniolatus]|uniref:uncharacterized protein LOC133489208 isoform X2 n=1 Tax=Phyllopteryx taeniolatus TaxID=161469 RepID=UPI002AD3E6A0|nr:uncharacterized protein LOC133489208 isoform X2 [Phyllopteryx taeniolatus]